MNFLPYPISELPFVILTMLIAFTVHEFAHAWTAWKFGDTTAYEQGRVTLNPMAHLDLFGMLFLIVAGFGWAKPVPVRRSRFKRPRLMSILVTAAGPVSNLLLALVVLLVIYALVAWGVLDRPSSAAVNTLVTFLHYWLTINVILFLFNLIPLPPLDGYRIVEEFAPLSWRIRMAQNEQWGIFVFLLLVFIPPLRDVTIDPLFSLTRPILEGMHGIASSIFGSHPESPILPSLIGWKF
ncbi:site-2 protease family protein [Cohnella lubricantis]|uniref:Site-2 protease family protein n=1 Tax=Cohnella lubricantis TaxID=2163172 RepID=A0A841TFM9_9BACL|nr:site-2 protease family protein [Cohnella lubricantis]MBB6678759.1 site-2 protease family protein [Cohnella lubricantis]MBP2119828.1 Zn-dependent protease [Cohnella lubricantis]